MRFQGLIQGVIALFFSVSVYGSSDTVIISISNSGPSYIDTMCIEASDWKTFEFDISGINRDSIKMITFDPHHHGEDTGGFYMKDITLYGSDTLIIEDFECYDPDSINGPGDQLATSDRKWKVTWVWDGSECYAAILQGVYKYMHCYYLNPLGGEVGSILQLVFSPNTRDWSQYNKICFTVRSDMPTGIVPKKKHSYVPDMTVHKHQGRGLFITLPAECESADFYLYSVSGRLLRQKSYQRNGPFFWQLPFIPNGAYILSVDDGIETYSDVITIER